MMVPQRKDLTPEQQRYREEITRRNAAIQAAKIKPPPSGIFGGQKREAKPKDGRRGR